MLWASRPPRSRMIPYCFQRMESKFMYLLICNFGRMPEVLLCSELFSELKGFAICALNHFRIHFVSSYVDFVECTVVLTVTMVFALCYGATDRFVRIWAICHFKFSNLSARLHICNPYFSFSGRMKMYKVLKASLPKQKIILYITLLTLLGQFYVRGIGILLPCL